MQPKAGPGNKPSTFDKKGGAERQRSTAGLARGIPRLHGRLWDASVAATGIDPGLRRCADNASAESPAAGIATCRLMAGRVNSRLRHEWPLHVRVRSMHSEQIHDQT
jgi:hypothetical protein